MTATITGFGKFNKGEDGIPYFALVSCKGLEHLKVDLERALIDDGLAIPSEHGFVPHMTLGYADNDPKLPSLDQSIEWEVTEVTIFADDNQTMVPVKFSNSQSVESMIDRVVAGEKPYEVIL
jgi:2'-5' RNA ligase